MVCAFSQPSINGFSNFQNMVKGLGKLFKKHPNNFPVFSTVWRIFAKNKKKVEKTANFCQKIPDYPTQQFFWKSLRRTVRSSSFIHFLCKKYPPSLLLHENPQKPKMKEKSCFFGKIFSFFKFFPAFLEYFFGVKVWAETRGPYTF